MLIPYLPILSYGNTGYCSHYKFHLSILYLTLLPFLTVADESHFSISLSCVPTVILQSVRSTARKSDDGSHYILNANKIYISNGGFADVFTVFAQVRGIGTTYGLLTRNWWDEGIPVSSTYLAAPRTLLPRSSTPFSRV